MTSRFCFARGAALAAALLAAPMQAQSQEAAAKPPLPIVFVHGNGDSAAEWLAQMWRFESNGYPSDRLFAVDLRYPTAGAEYNVPEPGFSTAAQVEKQLSGYVANVLDKTGAKKVILVGNSRGANTIRNFVKNGGGAEVTKQVVLGSGVNHGIFAIPTYLPNNEANGTGPFMQQLNAGKEVVPGVGFLTIRSDRFDKFAQPDGRFIGLPGVPTNLSYDAPALKGAKNIVLPGLDHEETAMSEAAFSPMYEFITGSEPERTNIRTEDQPVLQGRITGVTEDTYDNVPVKGAELHIYEVDPRTGLRLGKPVYRVVTSGDGKWGPFTADPAAFYEFLIDVPGQPITHLYPSPFKRSSKFLYLRPAIAVSNPSAGSIVILHRTSGYFGIEDKVLFDGARPVFSKDKVPNQSDIAILLPFTEMAHAAQFEKEKIVARNWPKGHATIVQFRY